MAKYHINSRGEAGLCRAEKNCPFGDDSVHFSTAEDARKAFELKMSPAAFPRKPKVTYKMGTTAWRENEIAEGRFITQYERSVTDEFGREVDKPHELVRGDFIRGPGAKAFEIMDVLGGQDRERVKVKDSKGRERILIGDQIDYGIASKALIEKFRAEVAATPEGTQNLLEELAQASQAHRPHGFPEDEQTRYYQDQREGQLRRQLEEIMGEDEAHWAEIEHTVTTADKKVGREFAAAQIGNRVNAYSWENIMGASRRTANNLEKYHRVLLAAVDTDAEYSEMAQDRAISERNYSKYARAFKKNVPIPTAAEDEFEKIWNGDFDSPGSEEYFVVQLENNRDLYEQFLDGKVTATSIVGAGLRNPHKAAVEYCGKMEVTYADALETRGRSYRLNVDNVNYRLRSK